MLRAYPGARLPVLLEFLSARVLEFIYFNAGWLVLSFAVFSDCKPRFRCNLQRSFTVHRSAFGVHAERRERRSLNGERRTRPAHEERAPHHTADQETGQGRQT